MTHCDCIFYLRVIGLTDCDSTITRCFIFVTNCCSTSYGSGIDYVFTTECRCLVTFYCITRTYCSRILTVRLVVNAKSYRGSICRFIHTTYSYSIICSCLCARTNSYTIVSQSFCLVTKCKCSSTFSFCSVTHSVRIATICLIIVTNSKCGITFYIVISTISKCTVIVISRILVTNYYGVYPYTIRTIISTVRRNINRTIT